MRMSCVLALALAGCASANGAQGTGDAPPGNTGGVDAPQQQFLDAPARSLDAFEFRDAPAPPPDAFVFRDAPPPPDACVPMTTELLLNPTFDLTPVGTSWQATPIDPSYPIVTNGGLTAQSPAYYAWMGGITGEDEGEDTVTDMLYQDITVPAGTTSLTITGYNAVVTEETTTTTMYDTGTLDLIQTDDTPIENVLSLSNLTNTSSTWQAFTHVFTTNVAGQTVRLRMTTTNDITNATSFYFDTLALKATHCP